MIRSIVISQKSSDESVQAKSRSFFRSPDELIKFRYDGYGVRNYFFEILKFYNEL